jgi:alginate O-acetyltransferase complex protein AlgI
VVWGGLHGLYLAFERALRSVFSGYRPGPVAVAVLGLATYLCVNLAWVFFRAKTFSKGMLVLAGMFGMNTHAVPILAVMQLITIGTITSGILFTHWRMRTHTLETLVARAHPVVLSAVWTLMAFAIVIEQGTGNAFIYFQF